MFGETKSTRRSFRGWISKSLIVGCVLAPALWVNSMFPISALFKNRNYTSIPNARKALASASLDSSPGSLYLKYTITGVVKRKTPENLSSNNLVHLVLTDEMSSMLDEKPEMGFYLRREDVEALWQETRVGDKVKVTTNHNGLIYALGYRNLSFEKRMRELAESQRNR